MILKLSFTGDIMCSKLQNETVRKKYHSYDVIFDGIRDELKKSDYVCGNLETTIAGENLGYTQTMDSFNTPESFLSALKNAGFHFFSIANNHIMDRGEEGIIRTLSALKKAQFDFTGCYNCKEDAENVFVKTLNGVKIAFLSYTYGMNSEYHGKLLAPEKEFMVDILKRQAPYVKRKLSVKSRIRRLVANCIPSCIKSILRPKRDITFSAGVLDNVDASEINNEDNLCYLNRLHDKIQKARDMADLVVVCLHCGGQYNNEIGQYTSYIHQLLKNEPVDLVIGNHPHCVLPGIMHDKRLFVYSLGNFTFTPRDGWYIDGVLADYSILLNVYVDTESRKISHLGFSIIKNVRDGDLSQTFLLYDLINKESDYIKKKELIHDGQEVMKRFVGYSYEEIKKEYPLC